MGSMSGVSAAFSPALAQGRWAWGGLAPRPGDAGVDVLRSSRLRLGNGGRPPPPNHEDWRIPRAIPPCSLLRVLRSAGTHRPAAACVLSAAQGEVCVRVSTGNGGRPATREPQARRPRGARRGRGRGAPRFRGSAQSLPPGIRSVNPLGQLGTRPPLAGAARGAWGTWTAPCWHPGRLENQTSRGSGKPLPSGDIQAAKPPGPLPRLDEEGERRRCECVVRHRQRRHQQDAVPAGGRVLSGCGIQTV